MGSNSSLNAVAKKLGLSPTTVSYVMSGRHSAVKISEATAQKVRQAAAAMNYRPNFWARSLAQRRTGLIGVLFPDLTGAAAHEILQGVRDVLAATDYEPLVGVSFWDGANEQREIGLMLQKGVEGILALPLVGEESRSTYQAVVQNNCSLVFVGDRLEGVDADSVTFDGADGMRQVVAHLHAAGRRRLHLLTIRWDSAVLREREEAFRRNASGTGDSVSYAQLAQSASVHEQVRRLFQRSERPDALACISDAVAFEALAEFCRLEIAIPESIAVAGIGNLTMSEHPLLSLTTVDECRREIGRRAATLLIERIEQTGGLSRTPQQVQVKGPLIVRRSTSARM